jgi:hypothetical protein
MAAKILLLGYSYEDNFATLPKGATILSQELCQKKFAIGLEKLPVSLELNEQIANIDNRIRQLETLARDTFKLSWEQLIQEKSPHSDLITKAAKPLIPRAKTLAFNHAILTTLQKNCTVPFLGLGEKPDAQSILNCLSTNSIEWAALFVEISSMTELKNELKSLKTAVDAFCLTSPLHKLSEEIEMSLTQARITPLNTAKIPSAHFIEPFIQKACKSLHEQARLLTSMRAIGDKHRSKSFGARPPATQSAEKPEPHKTTASTNNKNTPPSLAGSMKKVLADFRNVFNEGNDNGPSSPTIVGDRHNSSDE